MNRIFSFLKEKKLESGLAITGVVLLCVLIFLLNSSATSKTAEIVNNNLENPTVLKHTKLLENLSENIQAKAYYVVDLQNGKILFSKNENEKLPLASLTKLMSSLVITENLPSFTLIPITKEAIALQGDSGLLFKEGWKLKDLMDYSLITSSNDGISALASVLDSFESPENTNTVKMMNARAKELNLSSAEFFNETGLDLDNGGSGGYASAKDTANLIAYILNNNASLLSATAYTDLEFTSENNITHNAKNTNQLSENIPSLIASKTGFTDFAGGNLVVAFDVGPSRPIVAVVMGSSIDGRFSDMENIVSSTFDYYSDLDFNI